MLYPLLANSTPTSFPISSVASVIKTTFLFIITPTAYF